MFEFSFLLSTVPPIMASLPLFGVTLFDPIVDALKSMIDGVVSAIKSSVDWILGVLRNLFDGIAHILAGIKTWFELLIFDQWEKLTEQVKIIWDLVLEYLWWVGEWWWDKILECLDWLMGLAFDGFLWLLSKLPPIVLPQGWEQGAQYFVFFGHLLDQVLPVRELFGLLVLMMTLKIIVGIIRLWYCIFIARHVAVVN